MSIGNISLTRRNRITGQGHSIVKNEEKIKKIDVNFDLSIDLHAYFLFLSFFGITMFTLPKKPFPISFSNI